MGRAFVVVAAVFALAAPVRAGPDAAVIRAGKAAAAVVVSPDRRIGGSSFCIDGGGFFLTTTHALRDAGAEPKLVANAGDENERALKASILRVDKAIGLALLKVETPAGPTTSPVLDNISEADPLETMQVVVFGYPADDALSAKDGKLPSVNVNLARVNAIRKAQGRIQFLQLDTQLDAGNCGGAVLDLKGNIVGVLGAPIRGNGSNLVIPISQVQSFLAQPHISFAAPQIAYARRHEQMSLSMHLLCFGRNKPKLAVDISLSSSKDDHRRFDAAAGENGIYTAKITPLPPRTTPTTMPAVINYAAGQIRCTVEDMPISLDDRPLRLSQLGRLDRGKDKVKLAGRDGGEISGSRLSIGALKADFGGYITEIDTFKAISITFGEPQREPDRIAYVISVRRDGGIVAESRGELTLVGSDPQSLEAAPAPKAVANTGGPTTRETR